MIISASRRTDIPAFYSDWFFNRLKEQYVMVRNPMNFHQVGRINLSPDVVDCIVFWTKNPEPMLDRLDELRDYNFYFQFTLTSYGRDMECNVPDKSGRMLEIFQKLSDKLGADRVIWRYDPILFNAKYTMEYHIDFFEKTARQLKNYTKNCTISFIDFYRKIKKNIALLGIEQTTVSRKRELAKELAGIAAENNLSLAACAEEIDLSDLGIAHAKCIDDILISYITKSQLDMSKDTNQRPECGCMSSIDIGAYNTCKNGCIYCYANHSSSSVRLNTANYNAASPLLCSGLDGADVIKDRKMKSLKGGH